MKSLTLRIFRAPSGQWSGHLVVDGKVIGGISGCASPEVVRRAVSEQGFDPEAVEIEASPD
ncbi:hypothetical protein [Caballeronia sp. GAFFF1]|uniref:hypothetical protein n=1 Tax=Caballeronia sp. GAFFF1 TaxID=2921779 RepID=UPI0020284EA2|nr:hypothetical protein [Caballeronia sp. GAFFF1]